MQNRVRLTVLGITYNQVSNGAYALILSQHEGNYRIPIVIGVAEAQSIAAYLKNVTFSRPLTHEMFQSVLTAFGVVVKEVYIYRFAEGVFYSEITFDDGDREIKIDSRTSDAVALSLRYNAPIYTTEEILKEVGFEIDLDGERIEDDDNSTPVFDIRKIPLEKFSVAELNKMLEKSIDKEDYERAAEIKEALDSKKEEI